MNLFIPIIIKPPPILRVVSIDVDFSRRFSPTLPRKVPIMRSVMDNDNNWDDDNENGNCDAIVMDIVLNDMIDPLW